MSRCRIVIASLAFLLTFPPKCAAQRGGPNVGGNTVGVSGTIFAKGSNRPVEHATVQLCDTGGDTLDQGITTDSGEFRFRVSRGKYILVVHAAGYEHENVHVDLSFNSDRGIYIYLSPASTEPHDSAPGSRISAHEMSMPQKARDLLTSGKKKLYQEKDVQGGLKDFQGALSIAPGYYEAYYQIGMAYVGLGKSDEAEKNFRKCIEASGDKYGEADIGLGTLMLNRGDLRQGGKTISHGVDLSPDSWLGQYELGRALLGESRIADAQKSAERAVALAPNAPVIYRLLANIHLKEKDYPALLQDLDTYIKLDPDSPTGVRAKELRGQVSRKIGSQTTSSASPRTP